MQRVKIYVPIFLGLFISCFSILAQENDPVIMKINGKEIYKSEFEYIYKKNSESSADKKDLEEYVDMFVKFKLKVAAAEAEKLDTLSSFQNELNEHRRQSLQSYMTDKKAEDNVLKEAYERLKENIEISNIYIKIQEPGMSSDTLAAYKKALKVRNEALKEGADFEALALKYSDDPMVQKNKGYLGYITGFVIAYPFESVIYDLQVGDISMPFKFGGGYYIVKILNRCPDQGEVLVSHILKLVSKGADSHTQDSIEKNINDIYTLLEQGGDFAELAKKESDDKGSAAKGGTLSWFGIGRMIRSFEKEAFSLQKGDISKPFRTELGWHIIKLQDKRSLLSFEEKKSDLQQMIQRDERINVGRRSLVLKLKKEYQFTQNEEAYKMLYQMADHDFPFDSVFIKDLKTKEGELFSLDGKSYSIKDFALYIQRNSRTQSLFALDAMKEKLTDFEYVSTLQYEESQLDKKYPEFSHLMQEYRDGMLLFEISNREVWDKASKQKDSLETYFKENRSKFKWEKPHYKGFIIHCKDKKIAKQAKKLMKKIPEDSVRIVLNRTFNKEGDLFIKVTKGLFVKGENKYIDKLVYKEGKFDTDKKFPNVFVFGKNLKLKPESYTDIKGLVTADYQNKLEEEWIKALKAKYKVEIDESILKSIKN